MSDTIEPTEADKATADKVVNAWFVGETLESSTYDGAKILRAHVAAEVAKAAGEDAAMLDWLDRNMGAFFNSRYHVIAKFDGLRSGLKLAMQPDIDEGGDPGVHDAEEAANSAHCDAIRATDIGEGTRQ